MSKLREPALLRAAGGVIATAMVALGVTAVGLVPAQAGTPAPTPITRSVSGTGSSSFTVPAGVTKLTIVAQGASGGGSAKGPLGGAGALVSGTASVTPGDVVKMVGAAQGVASPGGPASAASGLYAGGKGGNDSYRGRGAAGAGGGVAAGVQINNIDQIVAAGGGGAGSAGGDGSSGCAGGVGADALQAGMVGGVGGGSCSGKGSAGAATGNPDGGGAAFLSAAGGGGGAGGGKASAGGGGGGSTGGGGGGGAGSSFLGSSVAGTVNYGARTVGSVSISYTVDTTTTVTATPDPAFAGDTIAYTVKTMVAGTTTPVSGPYALYAGACGTGALLGNGNLSNGTATVNATAHASVCASFGGAAEYNGSDGTATVTVNLKPTTTTVTASPNPALVGQNVGYTINTVVAGARTPVSGDFILYSGVCGTGTVLEAGTLVNGTATVQAPANASVCARFAGTTTHATSDGSATLPVNKDVTTTDVWLPSSPVYGQTDFAYIDVNRTANSWVTPSGTVTYSWNGGTPQTGTLNEVGIP
ncbi:hypothetical protein [Arthrobacter sp. AQ5-05]|uniref:hypothetical protein n=1 Tax=Arthrobacter sp. AQ5-05 TaxID=2184581 RepID=UPI0012B5AD49|nr:hypothetical protein [Arthrobacter sp. AQ5-05]